MSELVRAAITAVAKYHPEKVVTNDDLSKMVDTNDEWIRSRTGIEQRRKVKKGQVTSDLATIAILQLLKRREVSPLDIECILVATITPDMPVPAVACIIQEKIGASNAWGMDLNGACSGFLFALSVGEQFIRTKRHKKILVVGVDVMSGIVNYQDRNTCVLFGDGCGVALLEPEPESTELGILDSINRSDGSGADFLKIAGGGSLFPATLATVEQGLHFVQQDGKHVFKRAISEIVGVTEEILEKNGFTVQDVDYFIPHQANMRIIEACREKLGLPLEKVVINIDKFANTTAATVPSCLAMAIHDGKLTKGKLVVLASFGAGFTWGATLIRWAY